MTLFKWVRDDIEKISYVKNTRFSCARYYIYYDVDGKEQYKVLPFRADKNTVLKTLRTIEKEIGYDSEERAKELKLYSNPLIVDIPAANNDF